MVFLCGLQFFSLPNFSPVGFLRDLVQKINIFRYEFAGEDQYMWNGVSHKNYLPDSKKHQDYLYLTHTKI